MVEVRPLKALLESTAKTLALATGILLVHLALFGTRFETNDDLSMALALRGFVGVEGAPIISFHPVPYLLLCSRILAELYRLVPSLPWYALCCFFASIASLALASKALEGVLGGRYKAWLATAIAYAILFPNFDQTSFTRLSILVLGTGILLAFERALAGRATWRVGGLLAALTAVCYLVRNLSTAAALGTIAASAFLLLPGEERWGFLKRVLLPCGIVLVLLIVSTNLRPASGKAKDRLGLHLSDYESCSKIKNASTENQYIQMVYGYRFLADRQLLDDARLRRSFDELGCGEATLTKENVISRMRWFRSYLRSHALAYSIVFLSLLPLSVYLFGPKAWPLLGTSTIVFGALGVCAVGFKIEHRIFQPLLAEGSLLGLIWLLSGCRREFPRHEKKRRAIGAMIALAAIAPLSIGIRSRVPSAKTAELVAQIRSYLNRLDEVRKTRDVLVTSDARMTIIPNQMPLFSELFYRSSPDLRPLNFLGSWMVGGDSYAEAVARIGGTGRYVDFFAALVAKPESVLFSSHTESEFLRGYFAIFYSRTLTLLPEPELNQRFGLGLAALKYWKPRFD